MCIYKVHLYIFFGQEIYICIDMAGLLSWLWPATQEKVTKPNVMDGCKEMLAPVRLIGKEMCRLLGIDPHSVQVLVRGEFLQEQFQKQFEDHFETLCLETSEEPVEADINVLFFPKLALIDVSRHTRMLCEMRTSIVNVLGEFTLSEYQVNETGATLTLVSSGYVLRILIDMQVPRKTPLFSIHDLAYDVLSNTFVSVNSLYTVEELLRHAENKELHIAFEGTFNYCQHINEILQYALANYVLPLAVQECMPSSEMIVKNYSMCSKQQGTLRHVSTFVNCLKMCGLDVCTTTIFGGFVRDCIVGATHANVDVRCIVHYKKRSASLAKHTQAKCQNALIVHAAAKYASLLLKTEFEVSAEQGLYTAEVDTSVWTTYVIKTPTELYKITLNNYTNDARSMTFDVSLDFTVNALCLCQRSIDTFTLEVLREDLDLMVILRHLAKKELHLIDQQHKWFPARLQKMQEKGYLQAPKSVDDLIESL